MRTLTMAVIATLTFVASAATVGIPTNVNVPAPTSLTTTGTLLINGTSHHIEDPNTKIYISNCSTDKAGKLLPHGCQDINMLQSVQVGRPIVMTPGTYLITYSNTVAFVTITANNQTVLQLLELQAGDPAEKNLSFGVRWDLTDPSMQDLYLREIFYREAEAQISDNECGSTTSRPDAHPCKAYKAGPYVDLRNTVVKFGSDGTVYSWHFCANDDDCDSRGHTFTPDARANYRFVNGSYRLPAGSTVAVLPGVYSVSFTNEDDGQATTITGIVAN